MVDRRREYEKRWLRDQGDLAAMQKRREDALLRRADKNLSTEMRIHKYLKLSWMSFCGVCGRLMDTEDVPGLKMASLRATGAVDKAESMGGVRPVLIHKACVRREKMQRWMGMYRYPPRVETYVASVSGYAVSGEALQKIRVKRKMEVAEMADLLEWSVQKVSNIIYGNQQTVSVEDRKAMEFKLVLTDEEIRKLFGVEKLCYQMVMGLGDLAERYGVFKSDVGGIASWSSLGGRTVTRETADRVQTAFDEARKMPMYRVKRAAGEVRSLEELL